MIKQGQTLTKDILNAAFLSKTSTGTQIVQGSINVLGTIDAGSFIGTHVGNGAELTALNASNISSGRLADARLSTNVALLAGTQTFTGVKTFNANVNLGSASSIYFAGGTTYYVDHTANAVLKDITAQNLSITNLDIDGELSAGAINLFPDPYMNAGLGKWGSIVASELTAEYVVGQSPVDVQAYGALKLTTTSAATDGYYVHGHYFDALAGESYVVSTYAFSTTATASLWIGIRWYNASGAHISSIGASRPITASWSRYSQTVIAPANARYGNLYPNVKTKSTSVFLTGFQIEQGKTLTRLKAYTGGAFEGTTSVTIPKPSGGVGFIGFKPNTGYGEGILNLYNEDGVKGRITAKGNAGIALTYGSQVIDIGREIGDVNIKGTSINTVATNFDHTGRFYVRSTGSANTTIFNNTNAGDMYLSHGTGSIYIRTHDGSVNSGAANYTIHSMITPSGSWSIGTTTSYPAYKMTIAGAMQVLSGNIEFGANNSSRYGIQRANYIYFDYNGSYGTSAVHAITSTTGNNIFFNSLNNVYVNLDSSSTNSTSTFKIAEHSTTTTGNAIFEANTSSVISYKNLLVPAGNAFYIGVDGTHKIGMKSYGEAMWTRNASGQFVLQSGTEGDNWTLTYGLKVPPTPLTAPANSVYAQLGQSTSNYTYGMYRGLHIVKYVSNNTVDGDFKAGLGEFSGNLSTTANLSAGGTLAVTGTTDLMDFTKVRGVLEVGSTIRRGSPTAVLSLYNNTNAADSPTWIELIGSGGSRSGELALSGTYVAIRTGSNTSGSGSETVTITSTETTLRNNLVFNSINGRGIQFWGSNNYTIFMATSASGRLDSTSDYNMYFKMGSGTNRGFVFQGTGGTGAQIDGSGKIWTQSGVRIKNKYEITYNDTEDSLDFVYG